MPVDVLEQIFSWLPPESLIRFKCVNKSWYAHINSLMKNSRLCEQAPPQYRQEHRVHCEKFSIQLHSTGKSVQP